MNTGKIITLLTDFGLCDSYVASMKGVILSLAPHASIVDACHEIPAQDIQAGAWVLGQYWKDYPEGTVHAAVVDPGVGTERALLLVVADGRIFIAPDNGLLTWVLKQAGSVKLARLLPDVHRDAPVSATFHGRDVVAHAAGLLAAGKPVEEISESVQSVVMPSWAFVRVEVDAIQGEVVHIDRFGNLITNITRRQVEEKSWSVAKVRCGELEPMKLYPTYGAAEPDELMALFGSSDTLEVAVNGGSASDRTGFGRGVTVGVFRSPF